MTTDHIVPRAKGGTNDRRNLVAACYRCNQNKADMLPTCTCARCQAAIEWHWQWLMERPFGERGPLVRKVEGLYRNRWPGEDWTRGVPRGEP